MKYIHTSKSLHIQKKIQCIYIYIYIYIYHYFPIYYMTYLIYLFIFFQVMQRMRQLWIHRDSIGLELLNPIWTQGRQLPDLLGMRQVWKMIPTFLQNLWMHTRRSWLRMWSNSSQIVPTKGRRSSWELIIEGRSMASYGRM